MFDHIDICKSCLCIITSFDCCFTNNCEHNSMFLILLTCNFTIYSTIILFFSCTTRQKKAVKIFPCQTFGSLCPIVQCWLDARASSKCWLDAREEMYLILCSARPWTTTTSSRKTSIAIEVIHHSLHHELYFSSGCSL